LHCQICGRPFKSSGGRYRHGRSHSYHTCPRDRCHAIFETAEEALQHAEDPSHRFNKVFYACPVSKCRLKAVGKVMARPYLEENAKRPSRPKRSMRSSKS
jgi:hypothetical protein